MSTRFPDFRISTDRVRTRGIGHLGSKVPLSLRQPFHREQALVWYELEYSPVQNPLPRLSLGMADESELSNATLAGLAQSEITIEDRDRPVRLSARQVFGCNASDQRVEFFPGIVDSISAWHPDRSETTYTLSAELNSRGILEPRQPRIFSFQGTLEASSVLEPFPGLTWTGHNGELFSLQLDFGSCRGLGEDGMHADILIERPRVLCSFRAPASVDHSILLDELEQELKDVLPLFSLLSRRPIWWRRLLIKSVIADEGYEARSSFRLNGREPKHAPETSPLWRLVLARNLAEHNAFEQLVISLRSARERESLLRAASLLTASYVEQSWEASYALAMAALETLIHGLDEVQPSEVHIPSAKWKRVAATVRKALRSCSGAHLSLAQLKSAIDKVPELSRPPLKAVLQHHVARLKVSIDDLWASHTSFEEGIAESLNQRNSLLHTGKITTSEEMFGNLWRVQIFVERLFLRAIEFPDTLLAWEHNQAVARANRDREIRNNPGMYPIESWMLVPKPWLRKPPQAPEEVNEPEAQEGESQGEHGESVKS